MSKNPSILLEKFCSRACLVLACSASGLVACSGDDSRPSSDVVDAEESGTLRLQLTARGASGALYRLRNATFQIQQIDGAGPIFPTPPPSLPPTQPPPRPVPIPSPRPLPPGSGVFDDIPIIVPGVGGSFAVGGSGGADGGVSMGGSSSTGGRAPVGGAGGREGVGGSGTAGTGSGIGGSGSSGFLTFVSTENDPQATTLETNLPGGLFLITLFDGWFLERVSGGEVTVVDAQLLSQPTVDFFISINEETFVSYRFGTSGDIVEFGEGRLIIDIEVEEGQGGGDNDPRLGVMENALEALPFTLEETLATAIRNAGSTLDGLSAYHAIIDSYATAAGGADPGAPHCDDELTNGQPSLNGFPLQCGRIESQQFDNIDAWIPTAAVNRLDLAPADGANCGQQRLVFANNSRGRMFVIIEGQIPNPNPECGVSACAPIAAFWTSLAQVTDPFERGARLREAFLTGSPELLAAGFAPFMNASGLGPQGGQIRTNNFDDFPWTLREFHFPDVDSPPVPVPVAESPNGLLWNDLSGEPAGAACRESFLRAAELGLTTDTLSAMSFPVAEACKDAESRNDFSEDYVSHLVSGSGAFSEQLAAVGAPFGLSAEDLAARARFAGACIGCHMEAGGSALGNGLTAPFQFDFVQVSEFSAENCGNGGTCFGISDALRNEFLPHRARVTSNLLNGPACGELPPEVDPPVGPDLPPGAGGAAGGGSVGNPAAPGVPAPPRSEEEVRYTLGGQLADLHAH